MKPFFGHITALTCLFSSVLLVLTEGAAQSAPMDAIWYDHHWWAKDNFPEACNTDLVEPDSGLYTIVGVSGKLPGLGYPYHWCLTGGVNDTLQASILFFNNTGKEYILAGEDYEQWFAPQVYLQFATDAGGHPFRDSTQIGYRMRGWYSSGRKISSVDTLWPDESGRYNMKLDIWNLPQGHFQICILPTDKLPEDFTPIIGGDTFEFYPARNLADSCNAYEGCFCRAAEDGEFSAAKEWVGKLLDINPTSVLGWSLKARNAIDLQDVSEAKAAYDMAIEYLENGSDPAMPDSTKRPLLQAEKLYIKWLQTILPYNRAQLGP